VKENKPMAYKDILVHLDDSPRSEVRLDIAMQLAARRDAHVAGLYVMDLPSRASFMAETSVFDLRMADEFIQRGLDQARTIADTVRDRFEEVLRKSSIRGAWRCVEGLAAETVAVHARYTDLAIVGQSDPKHLALPGESHIPETVILDSGRPVLVIPHFGDVKPIGGTVLVAWKSGREAARAVNDALPLLSRAKFVTVLAIDPQHGISEDGAFPAADISAHLARHGIAATAAHTVSGGVSAGNLLLNHVSDHGVDLIVAGGYGHSRAREFVPGGATRALLASMTVPVLFSH